MSQPKYIQDESLLMIIAMTLFCVALILWNYWSEKKEKEKLERENKSQEFNRGFSSWRVYLIAGTGLLIMIWELSKRIQVYF